MKAESLIRVYESEIDMDRTIAGARPKLTRLRVSQVVSAVLRRLAPEFAPSSMERPRRSVDREFSA